MCCVASSDARFGMATSLGKPSLSSTSSCLTLVREMGGYYSELVDGEARAAEVLAQEESRFAETLATGMALLDAETAKLSSSVIPGETVFRLYDTYGFPST